MFIFCILCYNLFYDFDVIVLNFEIVNCIDLYINFFFFEVNVIELLCFFLTLAAVIKSAQLGPHIWLPDSMEAPVPASALIHSATLVSAGVFLLLRFQSIFEFSSIFYTFLPFLGALTAFYGGFVACYQTDIKRILAYSTISHCGFLVLSCCTFLTEYTIFYLYVHGFFKAASFLCIGNIIRFSGNNQDMRLMGGFCKYMPFECIAVFVCFLNLAGLPFSFGFFIKHLLLITVYNYNYYYYIIYALSFLGALTGIIYCYRLFYYVFFDFKRGRKHIYNNHQYYKCYKLCNNVSIYFSVTTMASTISISCLLVVSYIISLYLYMCLCHVDFLYSSILTSPDFSTIFNNNFNCYGNYFNYGYFNVVFLCIVFILFYTSSRESLNGANVYEDFFIFILFFFFFYFFFSLF